MTYKQILDNVVAHCIVEGQLCYDDLDNAVHCMMDLRDGIEGELSVETLTALAHDFIKDVNHELRPHAVIPKELLDRVLNIAAANYEEDDKYLAQIVICVAKYAQMTKTFHGRELTDEQLEDMLCVVGYSFYEVKL